MSGQVITFYSYKGGTGRSMALANIACLLAQRQSIEEGKGVLMIDWNLEAPGLHRYFGDKFRTALSQDKYGLLPFTNDYERKLDEHPGLIDLFLQLDMATRTLSNSGSEESIDDYRGLVDEEMAQAIITEASVENFILKTDIPSLHIMKAGCFDAGYAARVSTFQWESLYNRSPYLISSLAHYLSDRYEYVLIDSRTGITDISGICTMLLPEKLVVVFTPNRQSLLGVQELVRRATKYRRQSDDLRQLTVFPLPSRIEPTEPTLFEHWRLGNEKGDIPGYQPLFEKLFEEVYDLPSCDLSSYFDAIQIQHVPTYAYGENVAVLLEKGGGRLSLPQSFETVVDRLLNHPVPWDQQLQEKDSDHSAQQIKLAEATYARLSVEQQEATKRLFTRLVRIARPEEGGEDTRKRVKFDELFPTDQVVAEEWSKVRLINIQQDEGGFIKTVEPVSESLIRGWRRLRSWIDEDRDFLLWRQSLRIALDKWESVARQKSALLVGLPLSEATLRLKERPDDLTGLETSFIKASIDRQASRRERVRITIAVLTALLLISALTVYFLWSRQQQQQADKRNLEAAYHLLTEGRTFTEAGDYDSAIQRFNQAIQQKTDFAEAHYERGLAYDEKGERDRATLDYSEAIRLKPDYADAYLKRAEGNREKGEYALAIEDYSQALTYRPTYLDEAYFGRGLSHLERGSFDSAISDLNAVIKIFPGGGPPVGPAYFNRGLAYLKKRDLDNAFQSFDMARTFKNTMYNAETYFYLGLVAAEQEKREQALQAYAQAIELKPDYPEPYYQRGHLYLQMKNYDRAISDFNQAIRLSPNLESSYYFRGLTYKNKGDKERAAADFRKVLDISSDANTRVEANQQLTQLGLAGAGTAGTTRGTTQSNNEAASQVGNLIVNFEDEQGRLLENFRFSLTLTPISGPIKPIRSRSRSVNNIPVGQYTVTVRASGYYGLQQRITVAENANAQITFRMVKR